MENFLNQALNILSKSGKTDLAIIGKGKSIADLNSSLLSNFLIINLNDSEKIIAGEIAFLYRKDFLESVAQNGFKDAFYVAPLEANVPEGKHIKAVFRPQDQEISESIYEYIDDPEFYLTDFMLMSVVKFAVLYQKNIEKKINVYFLGFDFYTETSSDDGNSMHDLEYRNIFLKSQEALYIVLQKNFQRLYPNVSLLHVGEKKYSKITVVDFNKLLSGKSTTDFSYLKTNSILYKELLQKVNETNRTVVVAEFTNNHLGDKERLLKMIELAKEAGADMVKLQKRDIDSFYTVDDLAKPYESPFGTTLGDYRKGVELSKEMFDFVDIECRKREIPWFASVLDWNSYEFMLQFDTVLLKLPSTISNHKNYLLKVGQDFQGDLVISTGFTNKDYEEFVLDNFMMNRNLFLLQCTSSYPTPPEACQVAVVRHYDNLREKRFSNLYPGYSSHDIGSIGCMLSVAAGARMVEKHVKLGDVEWVHFDGVAIDLYNNHFKNFVHDIRKAEVMCGTKTKTISEIEHHKYVPNNQHN